MNLAFLFMEMHELNEAELQLREADLIVPMLSKRIMAHWEDHYLAMCALWEFESGSYANAEVEIVRAKNQEYPACLRIRAKLHMVRAEFAQAEALLRRYMDGERTKGTLLRPDLLKQRVELTEAIFGQGKVDDAIATFEEARQIVADFKLPCDRDWQRTVETWIKRARDVGKLELAAALEGDMQNTPAPREQRITILDKLRVRPRDSTQSPNQES
jgi:hypothetical protein